MNYIIYKIVKFIGKPLFKLFYRPRFIGLENIPDNDSVILAGNHTSALDALIMIAGPNRIVHMLAKKELFDKKIVGSFFRSMGCISVDRKNHCDNAKEEAICILNDGGVVGIFPEGTINRTDNIIMPFKYGAVSFAKNTASYIVPFSITGKYKLFKKSVKIIYGKPYKVVGNIEEENIILMKKVKSLIKRGNDYDTK